MISILIREHECKSVTDTAEVGRDVKNGWRELSAAEISAAGMVGYEHLVCPINTVVHEDGTIVFTPPAPPSDDELYEKLRLEAERRLSLTDKYATVDYPDSALRETVLAYRADLRAINRQPGAPWDGGGELTPWPELPTVE